MQEVNFQNKFVVRDRSVRLLPILILWGLVFAALFTFLIVTSDEINVIREYYLVPWVILTGAIVAAPSILLWYRNQFSLFNPIVFAAWSYFLPAFVLGGFILAAGWSEPYFLTFVQDPTYNLPFTLVIVILGYGGLSLGYFVPFGKKLGTGVHNYLPKWQWNTERVLFPGFILLLLGLFNTILGYVTGLLGYQTFEEIGTYDGLIFLMSLLWLEASFLLWLVLFKRKKVDLFAVLIGSVLVVSTLAKALYAGNRGSLFTFFILLTMAYVMSGAVIKLKQGVLIGTFLVCSLVIGMIYGTTFRTVKGTEAAVGMGQYTDYIFDTITEIGKRDNLRTLETSVSTLAERVDAVSSLAVVVSNYEELQPYEESYGLDNNIWKDTVTFIVPRVIWQDKPVASEPRKYSELYFDFGENSFTITPMGDLIRNFGVIGVPIGMFFLGFLLRIIYSALVENRDFSVWRSTFYYMLLTSVSYEGFYGAILPYLFKVGIIALIGILIVNFLIKKSKSNVFSNG